MLTTLQPIVRQLEETYDAVAISVKAMGEEGLGWKAGPELRTFALIAEHIANANLVYASMIGPADVRRTWELDPAPAEEWLLARLTESMETSCAVLEAITEERLLESRADDWRPNCPEQEIMGPLDALWFTQQMVRHTAYHLGQLNLYLQHYLCPGSK